MSKTLTLVIELDDNSPAEALLAKLYKEEKWTSSAYLPTEYLKGMKITAIGEGDIFAERDTLKEELEAITPPPTPLEIVDREKIYEIAKTTREELQFLLKKLSPHTQKTLQGAGIYGSVLLFDNLKAAGIKSQIVQAHGHYFVVCSGYLVDITASQFGQAKVVVKPYSKVKEMISTGDYGMTWWTAVSLHDEPCHASLCAYRKQLADTRKSLEVDDACNTCEG